MGEELCACIKLVDNAILDEQEIKKFCKNKVNCDLKFT
jgi:hypothetical protein